MTALREDLLHLTPEALAHIANTGIVKRAQRELAGGYRPRIAVDAAGLLDALFDDGIACTWPRGASIQQARCNCGAGTVCRHRVIVALAYRESMIDAEVGPVPAAAPVHHASDELLAQIVPAALLAEARALMAAGMRVELHRVSGGEPCDTARLPSATVRYWGGAALAAARCDCVRAVNCEHVAIGLWAFREGERQDPAALRLGVRLGAEGERHTIGRAPFEPLVERLLRHGVAQGNAVVAQALSSARTAATDAVWLALVVADIEGWSEAYTRRSALYQPATGADLLAELALRIAAGAQPGNAEAVLGIGQAGETSLDRLHLLCLGARTTRDGPARHTTLALADVDTGTRLVLRHDWRVPDGQAAAEAAIRSRERLAPGVLLQALAQGQLLAQQAARRPDGSLRLARARTSQNSVLPQTADWSRLGKPLRLDRVAALREELHAHPVAALQPRHAARHFVVFSPAKVEQPSYDPQAQGVVALLRDIDGDVVRLRRFHQGHLPHALDVTAAAVGGRYGTLRHVAGVLHWEHGCPVIEPWSLGCEGQVVVPDFAGPAGVMSTLPLGMAQTTSDDPAARQLESLRQHLGSLLHHGLAQLPASWCDDARSLARALDDGGLRALAKSLHDLAQAVGPAQAHPVDAALAGALLDLLALQQLHLDAANLH